MQPAPFSAGASLPRDIGKALEKMATEALVDGALLEDYNAELAATALPDVKDPAARDALVRVVEDEREHARLAWDIVAWCIERGGDNVADAVWKTLASVPEAPVSFYAEDLAARVASFGDEGLLSAHGRVRADVIERVFRERRTSAVTKVEAILGARHREARAA